jgi:hypothetical protein
MNRNTSEQARNRRKGASEQEEMPLKQAPNRVEQVISFITHEKDEKGIETTSGDNNRSERVPACSTPTRYRPFLGPWVFALHPLDVPDAPPAAIRVRRFLKCLGRAYGLRVEWPGVEEVAEEESNHRPGREGIGQ